MSDKKIRISSDFLPTPEVVERLSGRAVNGSAAPKPTDPVPISAARRKGNARRATTESEAMDIILGQPSAPNRPTRVARPEPTPRAASTASPRRVSNDRAGAGTASAAPSSVSVLSGVLQFGSAMAVFMVGAMILPFSLVARAIFPARPAEEVRRTG